MNSNARRSFDHWIGFGLLTLVTLAGLAALAMGVAAYINRDIPRVQGMGLVATLALGLSAVGWYYWRKEAKSDDEPRNNHGAFPGP